MQTEPRFGSRTLAAAGCLVIGAQSFHPAILDAISVGHTAGWLVLLLAGLIALAFLLPVASTLAAMPQGNLIDLARAAAGEYGAALIGPLLCGTLTFTAGVIVRQTSEMAVSAVYAHTPQTVAMVTLGVSSLYVALGGPVGLVTLARVTLPLLVGAMLLIFATTMGWVEWFHLLPLWGTGAGALPLRSVLPSTLYGPALFMLLVAGEVRDRQNIGRAFAAAVLGASLILAATAAMLILVYPYPAAQHITFPLHELSRLVIGGRFFERMDGIWVLVWVYVTIIHLAALYYTAARAYADAFGLLSHRPAVLAFAFISLVIALFPQDQVAATAWPRAAAPVGLATGLLSPLLVALVVRWRRRVKRGAA